MRQTMEDEGVTDERKRTAQMRWVQHINNIANRAAEIVRYDMIYA